MDSDKKLLLGWVAAGVLLAGACASILMLDYRESLLRERYSGEHFCAADIGDLQSHTVFLLDFSDPVTKEGAEKIKKHVLSYRKKLPVRGKLRTLFINAGSYDEIYAVCKPPVPGIRNQAWDCGDPLYGLDKASQAIADRFCNFKKQMKELADKIVRRSKSRFPSSPLIETLADVSSLPNFRGIAKKEIVLFSDLLQNTDRYSFYPDRGSWPIAQVVLAKENIDLAGTRITVHQIQRKSHNPRFLLKAKTFWEELFNLARAEKADFHSSK